MTNELPVWRARRRVSQRDVAKATGISYDRYWRIENDHAAATDQEQAALARYFETTPIDLFPALATEQPASQETR